MKYVLLGLLILLSFACENKTEASEADIEEIYQEEISNSLDSSKDKVNADETVSNNPNNIDVAKALANYDGEERKELAEANTKAAEKWEKQYGKYWRIIRQDVTRPYVYISLKYIDAFSDEKIFTTDIETYRRYSNDSKAINDHLKYSLLDKAEKEFLKYKSSCKVIERECHLFITYEEASEHRFNLKNK